MAKNHMSDIAELLGIKLNEEFKIKLKDGDILPETYKFSNGHFKTSDNKWGYFSYLYALLIGDAEVVKLPWKPQEGETYYYPNTTFKEISCRVWINTTFDYFIYNSGMYYRTETEAQEHFVEDYKKLTGKELEND